MTRAIDGHWWESRQQQYAQQPYTPPPGPVPVFGGW